MWGSVGESEQERGRDRDRERRATGDRVGTEGRGGETGAASAVPARVERRARHRGGARYCESA